MHATLDQLREAYVDLYEEAEAISRSSVVAAEQRVKRQLKGGRRAAAAAEAPRESPTGSRTACARPSRRPCAAGSARRSAASAR